MGKSGQKQKLTFTLPYLEVINWMNNYVKLRTWKPGKYVKKDIADCLEVKETAIRGFEKRGISSHQILNFAVKHNASVDSLLKKQEVISTDMPMPRKIDMEERPLAHHIEYKRRVEDIHYSEVHNVVREGGVSDLPEVLDGYPVLKLYLHKGAFQRDCHLPALKYVVWGESNMAPTVPAGSIVVIDQNERRITESLYVLKMNGAYLLKRLQPITENKVRVISDNPHYESFVADNLEIAPLIFGRAIWIVLKI